MTLPILQLRDIPEDGLTLDAPLDAAWLGHVLADSGLTPAGDPAGSAHVRVQLNGREVLLTGTVEAKLRAQCVRCLADTEVSVRSEFALNLEPRPAARGPKGKQSEVELTSDELDVDYYDDEKIDLGHWVREQILLEAPTHPVCPDGCREPISAPSAPEGERGSPDPRLSPLMKLVKKKE
jgi:uncharacterized protein